MADFDKISINGTYYNVKDSALTAAVNALTTEVGEVQETVTQQGNNIEKLKEDIKGIAGSKIYDVQAELGTNLSNFAIPDGYAVVWFRPGSYTFSQTWVVNKNVVILAVGASFSSNTSCISLQSPCTLIGGTFFSSAAKNIESKINLLTISATNVTIVGATFQNAPSGIVVNYEVTDVHILQCAFSNLYSHSIAAIWTGNKNNSRVYIRDCTFTSIALDAIQLDSTNSVVDGCWFNDIGNDPPYSTGAAGASAIYNELDGDNPSIITNNKIYDCGEYGINGGFTQGFIANNLIRECKAGGIIATSYARIHNNVIINTGDNGSNIAGAIVAVGTAYALSIIGNMAQGCKNGIYTTANPSACMVLGNIIQGGSGTALSSKFTGVVENNLT